MKITNSQLKELEIPDELYEKFKKIKGFTFDIDGVMTTGDILVAEDGEFLRTYNAKDGFGIRMASMNDYKLAIITGGHSDTIIKRFKMFGIKEEDIYLNAKDKIKDFNDFCQRHNVTAENLIYCGDDLPDLPIIKVAGIGVCPADAMEEVKMQADYVSVFPSGVRFVREIIEIVMRIQGKWELDVEKYDKSY